MSKLSTSLTQSIGSDKTADLLVTIGDTGIDAAISSGALDGVPILGMATGMWRAGRGIQQELFVRKVWRFLQGVNQANAEDRQRFTDRLADEGKTEEFGETILLILDRIDDTEKPGLIGRIMAAHLRGDIAYEEAMRLAAIISRAYTADLAILKSFKSGTQRERTPVAESLFAAGLLSEAGIDGGSLQDPMSGGTIYVMNAYGHMLVKHGLQ